MRYALAEFAKGVPQEAVMHFSKNLEMMYALEKPFITETLMRVNPKSPTKQSEPLCGKKRRAGEYSERAESAP